jgi:hypothetical protein
MPRGPYPPHGKYWDPWRRAASLLAGDVNGPALANALTQIAALAGAGHQLVGVDNTGAIEASALSTLRINVMDYWLPADGSPVIDGHTTRNIGPAVNRAYLATVALSRALTLWIPPASLYGVEAYSWDAAETLQLATDNDWTLEIEGSGQSSIIICDSTTTGVSEKLIVAGAGPQSMSTLFVYRNIFWMGDSTVTNDCISVLRTSLDISVMIDRCQFYALQSNDPAGVLQLNAMNLHVRETFIHGCGNSDPTKAIVSFQSGIFGATFEQVYWYPSEHLVNPFGGPVFDKATGVGVIGPAAPAFGLWVRGDALANAPRVVLDQCIGGGNGLNGLILADPGADFIKSIEFYQCQIRDNCKRTIRAVANVLAIVLNQTTVRHNFAALPTIALEAASCERLTIEDVTFSHNLLQIDANTGQTAVVVRKSTGGDYDLANALDVDIDANSTFDVLFLPQAGARRKVLLRATSVNGAVVNMVDAQGNELTLPDSSAFIITARLIAAQTAPAAVVMSTDIIVSTAFTTGGAAANPFQNNLATHMAAGHAIAPGAPGGLIFRYAVNGAVGTTVHFFLEVDFDAVSSP